ncbi:MAG: hypothetical protein JXA57_11985, partial [Armatimonadetes bacterium]|nr:hypothetical protein [Armatimonadota bacterium]
RMNLKEGFWTYLLPGTVSIRSPLKVLNFEAETALAQVAEPLAAMAWLQGGHWPHRMLDRAWRFLLGNHTHDAIAGCAPDVVSSDVAFRARQALDLADVVAEEAMAHLAACVVPADLDADSAALVAFNTLPFPRHEVIEVEVAMPPETGDAAIEIDSAEVFEEIGRRADSLFVDNRWDVPTIARTETLRLRIAANLPAMGCHALRVVPAQSDHGLAASAARSMLAGDDGALPEPVSCSEDGMLDNGIVRLEVQADGTATLTDRATGWVFTGLGRFRDDGALGTFWWPKSPEQDRAVLSDGIAQVEVVEHGRLQATVQTRVAMEIPRACEGEARSAETVPLTITTRWTLRMGDPLVRVEVAFDNQARDHRLRVLFPTGVETSHVDVGAHFDVVRRAIAHPDCTGWIEPHHGTAPMQGFVDLSDARGGLALIPHGLLEYEVFDDAERTLALTLIRSIPIRLAVSEEKMEILPDTGPLCLGPQAYRFALFAHTGDAVAAGCWQQSQRFNTPVRAVQAGAGQGGRRPARSLVEIDNPRVALTAVKRTEAGDELLLRLFNPGDAEETAEIAFGRPVASLQTARMDETPLAPVALRGPRSARVTLPAHGIVTVLVDPGERG